MSGFERPVYIDLPAGDFSAIDPRYDLVEPKFDGQLGIACTEDASTIFLGEYMLGSSWALDKGIDGDFYAFDLLQFGYDDRTSQPLSRRRRELELLHNTLKGMEVEIWSRHGKMKHPTTRMLDRLKLVPQYGTKAAKSLWQNIVLERGFEGLVFKSSEDPFGQPWSRMKRVFTVDYVILGFNQSKAKSKAGRMIQSIIAGLYVGGKLQKVCNVGGITNGVSRDMFLNPDCYINQVFEASGKGLFKSGALRHPNFVRMRPDKEPDDCVLIS